MKLAFYFTLSCTARCDHCITLAGPKVKRKMSLAQALEVVRATAALPDVDGIVFTGGENFMHPEELLELVRACRAGGLQSEVISNAYWAKDAAAARSCLAPFMQAGLDVLRISIDEFHLPYIAVERVHTALAVMGELGLERHVTCVVEQPNAVYKQSRLADLIGANPEQFLDGSEAGLERLTEAAQAYWPPDLLRLLDRYAFDRRSCFLIDDAVELREQTQWPGAPEAAERLVRTRNLVQYQFLATEGRGRMLLDRVASKPVDEIADTVCNSVGFTPVVNPEGDVFPCCSSWVNFPSQRIGNVSEEPLAALLERIGEDPIALFMHHQGPAVMVKYLRKKGIAPTVRTPGEPDVPLSHLSRQAPQLPERYTHPCHLCGTLLESFSREQLEAHIVDFYRENPWRMIFTSRGFDLTSSGETPIF